MFFFQLSGAPTVEEEFTTAEATTSVADLHLVDFKLPPPKELDDDGRMNLISSSLSRIWEGSDELNALGEDIPPDSIQAGGNSASEMWMLLLVRMITRVADPPPDLDGEDSVGETNSEVVVHNFYLRQDQLRQTLCKYIMDDFPSRVRLATTWMNEEWYNDQIRSLKNKDWVGLVTPHYKSLL